MSIHGLVLSLTCVVGEKREDRRPATILHFSNGNDQIVRKRFPQSLKLLNLPIPGPQIVE